MDKVYFEIHRDVDARKLKKVEIALYLQSGPAPEEGDLILDRCRMFSGLRFPDPIALLLWVTFPWRLERRKQTMLKRARIMLDAETAHEI